MDIKILKKVKCLSKTNRIWVSNGKAHFTNDKDHGGIWVTIDTDMEDGYYSLSNGKLLNLGYSDISEKNLGVDINKEMPMVDVTGIPYDIVNFVRGGKVNDPLAGIYIDQNYKCIVATESNILYSHYLKDIPESILLRPEFWKLMHHFNLTQIYSDGKYSIAKSDGVTIICELITDSVYPSWYHCIPDNTGDIELTDSLKKRILEGIKLLKPHYNKMTELIIFDGTYMKVCSEAGCNYKVDIGTELFPGIVLSLCASNLIKVLKDAHGYFNEPSRDNAPITIKDNNSISLIMPYPVKNIDRMLNTTFIELGTKEGIC